jgi:valyl-tRNA synthetase
MIMSSLEFMGEVPFKEVYFNGMIRDLTGKTMSKSLGNSPDPLWLIEGADKETTKLFAEKNSSYKNGVPAYGADAIRLTMVYLTPLGGDIHFDHTLVEMGQKFCNKLWNASRFILMNLEENPDILKLETIDPALLDLSDRWILSRLQRIVSEVRQAIETYRFNDATKTLYGFVWGEFCDWYLEMVKSRFYNQDDPRIKQAAQSISLNLLDHILRLLHPFMPFITEEIWQALPLTRNSQEGVLTIMRQPYPKVEDQWLDEDAEKKMDLLQKTIGVIRNIRSEMNVPQDKKAKILVRGPAQKLELLENTLEYLKLLGKVESMEIVTSEAAIREAATGIVENVEIFMPLEGLIDIDKEKERIQKEIERLENMLVGLNKKLNNHEFVKKAPAQIIEKEQMKQRDFREKVNKLKENLKALEKSI